MTSAPPGHPPAPPRDILESVEHGECGPEYMALEKCLSENDRQFSKCVPFTKKFTICAQNSKNFAVAGPKQSSQQRGQPRAEEK